MNAPKYIDKRSKEAYWVQLYHALRNDIINGTIPAKTVLPSPEELALQQAVEPAEIKKALDRLISEQLVEKHENRYVAGARAVDPLMFDRLTNLANVIESRSKKATLQDFPIETLAYDQKVLPEAFCGMTFYRMQRLFLADGVPVFYLDSYFDVNSMPSLASKSTEDTALYTTLYAMNNIQNYRSDRVIQATELPSDVASILKTKPGTGCIKTAITAYRGDQCFEYTLVWQLAEAYLFEFKMDLKD